MGGGARTGSGRPRESCSSPRSTGRFGRAETASKLANGVHVGSIMDEVPSIPTNPILSCGSDASPDPARLVRRRNRDVGLRRRALSPGDRSPEFCPCSSLDRSYARSPPPPRGRDPPSRTCDFRAAPQRGTAAERASTVKVLRRDAGVNRLDGLSGPPRAERAPARGPRDEEASQGGPGQVGRAPASSFFVRRAAIARKEYDPIPPIHRPRITTPW